MNEYATEIRIRFYDDIGTFKIEEVFKENVELYNEETYLKHLRWFGDDEE